MSSFRWGMIACPTPTNSQVTGWELRQPPVFLSLKDCHSLQPQKHVSTIWYLIQSLLGADQASIPHLKEEIVSFQGMQKNWNFLINRYNLSQVKMTLFQHGVSFSHLYQHTLTLWSVTICNLSQQICPPYPIWKGTSISFIWEMEAWYVPKGCRATEVVNFTFGRPSYTQL